MKNIKQYVLFVCEHGSAKSVVAVAHFNKLAREKGLTVSAISRGTDPDEEIPSNVLRGLEADGLTSDEPKPALLRDEDILGAICVVTFCDLPEGFKTPANLVSWEDVSPVSENYNIARDEITERITALLTEM